MSETVEQTEQATATTETSTGSTQETTPVKPTVDSLVEKNMQAVKDRNEGKQPAPDEKGQKKGQTVNERISSYANRAKEAEAKAEVAEKSKGDLEAGMSMLQEELAGIKKMLAEGRLTPDQAATQTKDAKDSFQEAIDGLNLPEDLVPYKDHLVGLARKMADVAVEKAIAPLREAEQLRQRESADRERNEFVSGIRSQYTETAKAFPELFSGVGEDGLTPNMKPEVETAAMKIAESFNIPFRAPDGKEQFYNPLLGTKEGIDILFKALNYDSLVAKLSKHEVEAKTQAVDAAKRGRVEVPSSTVTGAKPKTVDDIVAKNMKRVGMEVR